MNDIPMMPDEQLLATWMALESVNLSLANTLKKSVTSKPLQSRLEVPQGGVAGDKYGVTISIEDATAILDALAQLEKDIPYNTKFNGYQINGLVVLWRDFTKLIQQTKTPKLSD